MSAYGATLIWCVTQGVPKSLSPVFYRVLPNKGTLVAEVLRPQARLLVAERAEHKLTLSASHT